MALRNPGFYGLNMKFLKTKSDLYLPRDCSVNIQRGSDGRVVLAEGLPPTEFNELVSSVRC